MLTAAYHMLKDGAFYKDPGAIISTAVKRQTGTETCKPTAEPRIRRPNHSTSSVTEVCFFLAKRWGGNKLVQANSERLPTEGVYPSPISVDSVRIRPPRQNRQTPYPSRE